MTCFAHIDGVNGVIMSGLRSERPIKFFIDLIEIILADTHLKHAALMHFLPAGS
jgi:hypothetical protein